MILPFLFYPREVGANELAVLDDRAAAHECGQERTTKSHKTLKSIHRFSFFLPQL
jgi:hypothetical protein